MVNFLTKQLNVFVLPAQAEFVPFSYVEEAKDETPVRQMIADNCRWSEMPKEMRPERPHKKIKAAMGIDLSVDDDLSAVSLVWRKSGALHAYVLYFLPENTIHNHKNRALYEEWVEQGYLIPCGQDIIDAAVIFQAIVDAARLFDIQVIRYDSYKAADLINLLVAKGMKERCKPLSQTAGNYNKVVEAMKMALMQTPQQMMFVPNPITDWCFQNVQIVVSGTQENKMPCKLAPDSPRKIDGVMATLMAMYDYFN